MAGPAKMARSPLKEGVSPGPVDPRRGIAQYRNHIELPDREAEPADVLSREGRNTTSWETCLGSCLYDERDGAALNLELAVQGRLRDHVVVLADMATVVTGDSPRSMGRGIPASRPQLPRAEYFISNTYLHVRPGGEHASPSTYLMLGGGVEDHIVRSSCQEGFNLLYQSTSTTAPR